MILEKLLNTRPKILALRHRRLACVNRAIHLSDGLLSGPWPGVLLGSADKIGPNHLVRVCSNGGPMETWNVRFGSNADIWLSLVEVRFGGIIGHGLVKRICKPNCKPTARHRTVSGTTSQHHKRKNGEQERRVRHYSTRDSTRISKTVVRVTVPWVRIPPSPPASRLFFRRNFGLRNCRGKSAA
jgi:hypothetical protein